MGELRAGKARYGQLFLISLLTVASNAAGAFGQTADPLDTVRERYIRAVERVSAIDSAMLAIRTLEDELGSDGLEQREFGAVLNAYRAALELVRAKHGRWPPARLRQVRKGLGDLDELVSLHPRNLEVRFVRLMGAFHLPGILRPDESVSEDIEALGRLLPDAPEPLPLELRRSMIQFVLTHAPLAEGEREALERAASRLDDQIRAKTGALGP